MKKRELVISALEALGLPESQFSFDGASLDSALKRLDNMMKTWEVNGVRIGFPVGTSATSRITDDIDIPDYAYEGIQDNLALRIASMFGKVPSRDLKLSAKAGYKTIFMMSGALNPNTRQMPESLPRGAGNKPYRYGSGHQNYFPTPSDPVDAGPDSELELL